MRPGVLVAFAFVFVSLPRIGAADEVHLRGGSVLHGKATRQGDAVVVKLESGEIRLPASEVERIEESASHDEVVQRRRAALAANDVEGRLALAAYCRAHDLFATERALLLEVIDRVPEHARARRLLGHVKTEQGWVDRSQQRRAELEAEQTARLERQRAAGAAAERERAVRERDQAVRQAEAEAQRARQAEAEAQRARAAATYVEPYYYAPVYRAPGYVRPREREREPSWLERAPSQQRFPINGWRDPRDPHFHLPINDPRFR